MHRSLSAAALALTLVSAGALADPPPHARNVVIFVADGLRYDSVTAETAPTMWRVRHEGVDFTNCHAIYPTLTTANASAIATGHYLGDTGDYANTLSFGFPIQCALGEPATVTFLEDDCVLRAVKGAFRRRLYGPDDAAAGGARGRLRHADRRQEGSRRDPVARRARQPG